MDRAPAVRFVGIQWWGAGPIDFACCSRDFACSAVTIADLSGPLSRRVLTRPRLSRLSIGMRTIASARSDCDMTVVLSPHRLSRADIERLKSRTTRIVAWVGDEPRGARAIDRVEDLFDVVYVSSPEWLRLGTTRHTLHWPHLVPDDLRARNSRQQPQKLLVVGAPYRDRMLYVRRLMAAGADLRVVGRGWPDDIPTLPMMGRLQTLRYAIDASACILNIPHEQMRKSLNPFFFDLAAADIPQVVVGLNGEPAEMGFPDVTTAGLGTDLSKTHIAAAGQSAAALGEVVRQAHSVDARIKTMMGANGEAQ